MAENESHHSDNSVSADLQKSLIEKLLEVVPRAPEEPTVLTNAAPIWHPPNAKGIYGGVCIAQSINAGQATLPNDFFIQSMHGQFVLPGTAGERLVYHVEIIHNGRTFATRTVNVTQSGRTIFTALMSFARDGASRQQQLNHSEPMPEKIPEPVETTESRGRSDRETPPFVTKKVGITSLTPSNIHGKRIHHWSKSRHRISLRGGTRAHVAALAYICDNYFVGIIPHIHGVWDFVNPPLTEFDAGGPDLSMLSPFHSRLPASDDESDPQRSANGDDALRRIGMMVTLSHTMFFHDPRAVRADEWMLAELSSSWSGSGRGFMTQKIWTRQGVLVATCVQEGVVRLAENTSSVSSEEISMAKSRL